MDNSGFGQHNFSGYYHGETANVMLNIYSSRSKILEQNLMSQAISPKKEIDKALDHIFKGFSFYSEPIEE